ncbi:Rhamnogalacturonyl hydrolase YesR [Butyrivibrio proteoclasticus]|uniref:Rhamnogalacturonyl hydrolase YesR n=1 Tax=Butyrivibrio proteoclasticus TaxID=43305 RepID=A0A1I5PMC9_9FIRM|nr:glycoside hydrolase family 88 protein [Butyrivibrio proteoclasticus]SFP35195.1 Rhamnogalacturonyl hydrolase YesR [Butyrivibrio proteoclasticus]
MGYRVTDERYKMVIDRTVDDLLEIMNVSLIQQAKDVVKSFMGRSVRTKDPLFWPAGMLMLGLISAAEQADVKQDIASDLNDVKPDISSTKLDSGIKSKCLAAISAHLDMWLKSYDGKIDFVDDALAGVCFIRAYELTHEDKYKEASDKIAQFILTAPRDEQGTVIYNPGRNSSNIFADGVGQVSMFMAAYISAFPDSDIVISSGSRLDASKQIKNFFEMGVDKKSGLNYHGYSLSDNQKKGLLGWGRAFGWMYMGVAEAACAAVKSSADELAGNNETFNNFECVRECPDRKRCFMNSGFNITGLYRQMSRTALEYQRADGGWSWQIQGTEGHIDMSATGMIAYSLARGYNAGILDNVEDIDSSFDKAIDCMLSHTEKGAVLDALSSCDDFGVHYQTYGHYPWGQGAVLAALAEIR